MRPKTLRLVVIIMMFCLILTTLLSGIGVLFNR
ncbi:stressosome-associated protein Prli42 [Pullulanibacillus camelliae]|nr:stressosome-associated protein Prli42 [Pullulanibacillus camelliae]